VEGEWVYPVPSLAVPTEDSITSGSPRSGSDLYAADPGMRVRREEEDRVGLAGEVDVGDIAAPALSETADPP
jgi:hypothetical protein